MGKLFILRGTHFSELPSVSVQWGVHLTEFELDTTSCEAMASPGK